MLKLNWGMYKLLVKNIKSDKYIVLEKWTVIVWPFENFRDNDMIWWILENKIFNEGENMIKDIGSSKKSLVMIF